LVLLAEFQTIPG